MLAGRPCAAGLGAAPRAFATPVSFAAASAGAPFLLPPRRRVLGVSSVMNGTDARTRRRHRCPHAPATLGAMRPEGGFTGVTRTSRKSILRESRSTRFTCTRTRSGHPEADAGALAAQFVLDLVVLEVVEPSSVTCTSPSMKSESSCTKMPNDVSRRSPCRCIPRRACRA